MEAMRLWASRAFIFDAAWGVLELFCFAGLDESSASPSSRSESSASLCESYMSIAEFRDCPEGGGAPSGHVPDCWSSNCWRFSSSISAVHSFSTQ